MPKERMAEHCCTMMHRQVEEAIFARPGYPGPLVRYDERHKTYALAIPDAAPGGVEPIGYCPWCGTKLRRTRARGLVVMTPDVCRKARKAVSMTHRQVADGIGESVATVFHYEMGKPTDQAVVEKLLDFFQDFQIASDRSGRIGWYQR
jgi:hypothetical protein